MEFIKENYIVFLLFWLFCILPLIQKWINTKQEQNRIEEYRINMESIIDDNIPQLLDTIITDAFDEYYGLNLSYKDIDYINAEQEEKILRDVGNIVTTRISSVIRLKLSSYYNEEALMDIISKKVYSIVTAHIVQNNEVKNDEDDL